MSLRLIAVLSVFAGVLLFGSFAMAQEHAEASEGATAHVEGDIGPNQAARGGFVALAIGLGLGLAAAGGAFAQGRATASALEGLSRNPGSYDKVFTPFILGMVLIESLVIYSLVISLILLGSV